jgi:DNA-binding IclR family transcriptional regulator
MSKKNVTLNAPERPTDRHFVSALARGLEILRCFSRPQIELSISEIARLTGFSQPTAWRLCYTLLECGFLVRAPSGAALRIGAPAITLGYAAAKGTKPPAIALPYMQRLANDIACSVTLSLRQGQDMISIEQVNVDFVLPNQPIGWRAPMDTVAAGLAVLAALPTTDRQDLLATGKNSDKARWQRHEARIADALAEYEQRGFVTLSGILDGQYTAVAVPLFEQGTGPEDQWAFSCGDLSNRWTQEALADAGAKLVALKGLLTPAFAALSD